jgi:hypothetical protein
MSTDRYTLVTNAMQALHRTLVPSVLTYAPAAGQEVNSVETGHLPYIFTWVGAGQLDIKGGGWAEEQLTCEVFCFVEALGQNDLPSRQQQARACLAAVSNLYINVQNVRLLSPDDPTSEGYQAVIETGPGAQQVTSGGLQPLPAFGGRTFFGFRLQVPVFITWNPTTVAV